MGKTTRFEAVDYLDTEERSGCPHHGCSGCDALGLVAGARGVGYEKADE